MLTYLVVILFVFADIQSSYPFPLERTTSSEGIKITEADGQQLDLTSTPQNTGTLTERSKRTIGLLRDLFPELTKQIDDSVNKVVSQIIRVVGPAILRGAVRNRNSLPNTRSSLDIEFDSDEEIDNTMNTNSSVRVNVELPTILPYVKESFSSEKFINVGDSSQNENFSHTSETEFNDTTHQSYNEPIEGNLDYISMVQNPANYMCNGSTDSHLSECRPQKNHLTKFSISIKDQHEYTEENPVQPSRVAQEETDVNRFLPDNNFGNKAFDHVAATHGNTTNTL